MNPSVLIADDHELVRAGVRRLLEELGCTVVAEVSTGEEAVERVRELRPDIALIDIQMPGIGGMEASQRVRRFVPSCRVVILTAHGEGPLPRALLETGVAGFLTKGCAFEEMDEAMRKVARGERYVSQDVAQRLALDAVTGSGDPNPFDRLTARELQVALMMVAGETNRDISEALLLSPKTVTTYRQRILKKIGVRSLADLLRLAIQHNLTTAEGNA